MAQVAARLGTPLMPWQRLVADTALEIEPESGLPAYREVVVTVPRQSGKTTLVLPVMVHRALATELFGGPQKIVYTAQTRQDAREKWEEDHVPLIENSLYHRKRMVRVRRANGSEAFIWNNGSRHKLAATTEKGGHGKTLDLPVVDEAWAHTDNRIEQSFSAPMITRKKAQMWIPSTAGTEASVYLNAKVEAGRTRTTTSDGGVDSGVCYFEWSCPEGLDVFDPVNWPTFMPAFGFTIGEREIAIEAEKLRDKPDEFLRAYGNIATGRHNEPSVLGEQWAKLAEAGSVAQGRVTFAVAVSYNREWASITEAGERADGRRHVGVVDRRRGTSWVVERLPELVERHDPYGVVIDPRGPAASLVPDLEAAGVELTKTQTLDVGAAYMNFIDLAFEDGLRHNGDPVLAQAASIGTPRDIGDGARTWRQRDALGDISSLVSATFASWGHTVLAGPVPASAYIDPDSGVRAV